MDVRGFVHLFISEEDFDAWREALSHHAWDYRLYSPRDPVWQTVATDMQECIVVDLKCMSLETLARYAGYPAAPPILTIADSSNLNLGIESMRHGAWDLVLKPVSVDQLVNKIATALERERQTKASDLDWRARCRLLSTREHEVLHLLLDACNTAQIAHRLGISTKTAEKHRLHVLEKLNVQSVAELFRQAFRPRHLLYSHAKHPSATAIPQSPALVFESAAGIS